MSEISRVITLAALPVGFPSETDFKLIEEPKPAPGDGQLTRKEYTLCSSVGSARRISHQRWP